MMDHGLREAYRLAAGDHVGRHAVLCVCGKRFVRDRLADAAVALERHEADPSAPAFEHVGREGAGE